MTDEPSTMGRAGETVLPPMTVVRSIMARRRSGAERAAGPFRVYYFIYLYLGDYHM